MSLINEHLYSIVITCVFLLVYIFVRFKLKSAELLLLKNIKKRKIRDAAETESPVVNQEKN